MDAFSPILIPTFFIIAVVYSTAGFGGGSAYLAVLALAGVSSGELRPVALICNIIVATGSFYHYAKAGHFDLKKNASVRRAFCARRIPGWFNCAGPTRFCAPSGAFATRGRAETFFARNGLRGHGRGLGEKALGDCGSGRRRSRLFVGFGRYRRRNFFESAAHPDALGNREGSVRFSGLLHPRQFRLGFGGSAAKGNA